MKKLQVMLFMVVIALGLAERHPLLKQTVVDQTTAVLLVLVVAKK